MLQQQYEEIYLITPPTLAIYPPHMLTLELITKHHYDITNDAEARVCCLFTSALLHYEKYVERPVVLQQRRRIPTLPNSCTDSEASSLSFPI